MTNTTEPAAVRWLGKIWLLLGAIKVGDQDLGSREIQRV
jgi:hypothetical protein